MRNSRSFDRASDIYDQTRPLLEPISKYGIPALLDLIGSNAHVLEVGAGTGRISIPLLERGVDLVGCDLSSQMLRRFKDKLPSAPIVQADASLLPIPTAYFDTILTVHVMHLIPAWRETLREFRRALKRGGIYCNVRTWAPVGISVAEQIREFWRGWMSAHGLDAGHVGARDHAEVQTELRAMGANVVEVEAVRFPDSFTLGEELQRFESRVYSETWDLPDDTFAASMHALRAWMLHEYGSLDREVQDEVRFVIHVARFEA